MWNVGRRRTWWKEFWHWMWRVIKDQKDLAGLIVMKPELKRLNANCSEAQNIEIDGETSFMDEQ